MANDENIVSATLEEIKRRFAAGEDKSDWAAVHARSQEEADRLADEEDGPLPEGWEKTIIVRLPNFPRTEPKQDVHIRLDPMVLRFFKAQGAGYQTRINAVLRAYVEARQNAAE